MPPERSHDALIPTLLITLLALATLLPLSACRGDRAADARPKATAGGKGKTGDSDYEGQDEATEQVALRNSFHRCGSLFGLIGTCCERS